MEFNKSISIGGRVISQDSPVFLIAEAGVNHGGDIEVAKKMIDIASEAGVDAVKFQAFRTEHLILDSVEKAPYQTKTTKEGESQAQMLKGLELRQEHYQELKNYCDAKNIVFLITPFDEVSLDELEELNVEAYKIASTDTTNISFLEKVARTGKPIILSTGMCYLEEVEQSLMAIQKFNKNVILLQCTANYPLDDAEVNLNVLKTYANKFDVLLGFSDHSVGIGAAPYSIPLGAKVIEKHFTISKDLEGPDHKASLDPNELKLFVSVTKKVSSYMGSYKKEPTASEVGTRKSLQKCLVASVGINAGEVFGPNNIIAKRTGGVGINANELGLVYGQVANKDYKPNDIISL